MRWLFLTCLSCPAPSRFLVVCAGLALVQPSFAEPIGFTDTGALATARSNHTATLLLNGKVLVAGGRNSGGVLSSSELYDPANGAWTSTTGTMVFNRTHHTATLLRDGKVLIAGGDNGSTALNSAALYDPVSGFWMGTNNLGVARVAHTATLLPNGNVLVVGGDASGAPTTSAEVYNPTTGTWSPTGNLISARANHTATLLPNGKVLVAGGYGSNNAPVTSAEVYDPANGTWSATGDLGVARHLHTATLLPNGMVLIVGGIGNAGALLMSAELYDPARGTWTPTGSLFALRSQHTATLLPNGTVLVIGGDIVAGHTFSPVAELYNPSSGTWSQTTGTPGTSRQNHTATLLLNGRVLIAGGVITNTPTSLASAQLYDSATGSWSATGNLGLGRATHTATLLPDGKVLAAGGGVAGNFSLTAQLYDPISGTWAATGSMSFPRENHAATLLPNGKVLVEGGFNSNGPLLSADLYDPLTGTWNATSNLTVARQYQTATLLPDGRVLVAGGNTGGSAIGSAELYDPAPGSWKLTGGLIAPRTTHTATLLLNGKVLVAGGVIGGVNGSSYLASAELYDPAAGTWQATGSLATGRSAHTATLLPNGKVLVVGGVNGTGVLSSAEIYDPASGTWSSAGNLTTIRVDHTATLLSNGQVLVAGGLTSYINRTYLATTELYDPALGTWTPTASMATARTVHTATLLTSGKVLAAGGSNASGNVAGAELYDEGLGFAAAWQPQIATATLQSGNRLVLTGSLFQGISQASGGNTQDSSSNYPVVQLRSLDNDQVVFLPVDPAVGWSNTTFASLPTNGFPFGPARVTVFTNGISSASKYLVVPQPTTLLNLSTRLRVLTGENVLIGGFIITGTEPKKILLRGIGPSLNGVGVTLPDPILELKQGGTTLALNDNWKTRSDGSSQQAEIEGTTIPPKNDLESALLVTLNPGTYTAILSGKSGGTGVGLVEIYNLTSASYSRLANSSTRGFVDTGDNAMIAGFILGGTGNGNIIIRALGPSLAQFGFTNALADPTLELRDGNGTLLASNNNWKINDQTGQSQEAEVRATTIQPSNDLESTILTSVAPGLNYTAIVRGNANGTGVGLVEVYNPQ